MEQRRLRLGDILDDYCPRERRVTNHAVVAMIEEDVKQTRCTTCDAEHAYKGARVPKRRKKETPSALYKEVLAGMPEVEDAPVLAAPAPAAAVAPAQPALPEVVAAPTKSISLPVAELPSSESFAVDQLSESPAPDEIGPGDDEESESRADAPVVDGPVHRPLIRATLPRPEGQKDARPVPDFTARHVPQRGSGGFRGDRDRSRMRGGNGSGSHGSSHGHGNVYGNGNRTQGGPRFQSNRPSGQNRQPTGRAGGQGFRNGGGNGNGNKRGRGSRG
jgi:hypothetical protein